jgi:hypothetical protein
VNFDDLEAKIKALKDDPMHRSKYAALMRSLSIADRIAYRKHRRKESAEGPAEIRSTVLSPSGRYRLDIYGIKTSGWGYSKGIVIRLADGCPVSEVLRNYSVFPYCWVEDHVDGHDYLVCGWDYQAQTYCQLDTGEVRDTWEDDADEGFGFCWATIKKLDPTTLLVAGCYWGGPYEYRLVDVSNPMVGTPYLTCKYNLMDLTPFEEDDSPVSLDDYHAQFTVEDDCYVWRQVQPYLKETGESSSQVAVRKQDVYRAFQAAKNSGDVEKAAALELEWSKIPTYDEGEDDDPQEADLWGRKTIREIVLRRIVGEARVDLARFWTDPSLLDAKAKAQADKAESDRKINLLKDQCPIVQHARSLGHTFISHTLRHNGTEWAPHSFTLKVPCPQTERKSAYIAWPIGDEGEISVEWWLYGKGNLKDTPTFPNTIEGFTAAWAASVRFIEGP